jgi:hypothetical protein
MKKQIVLGLILISFNLNSAVPTATPPVANKGSTMPLEAKTSPNRVAARSSRPSEAETAVTPQPKRNTTSMQPNSGKPAEVNRASVTKQPAGSLPTVKAPNGGVPKYPEPKAVAPKSSIGKQPTGNLPTVKRPEEGVPSYPLPKF